MKYKLVILLEKDFVDELNRQDKLGYEYVEILATNEPTPYVSDRSFRVLFIKVRK